MKYLLDTNVIIALTMNNDSGVVARAGECDDGDMVTSAIAMAEVAFGSARAQPPGLDQLAAFVEEVPVLDFDYKAAVAYAAIPVKRASYDRLIAAHALSHGLTVVTANVADFADVPGLKLEDWSRS